LKARYGALARFAAAKGAEWSLAWPAKGMALDSCARLMVLFVRPEAAGSDAFGVAGPMPASAGDTEVVVGLSDCVPGKAFAAVGNALSGEGGRAVSGVFWQPISPAVNKQTMAAARGARMGIFQCSKPDFQALTGASLCVRARRSPGFTALACAQTAGSGKATVTSALGAAQPRLRKLNTR
jgi:hypothetical protein